MRIRIYSE